MTIDKRIIGAAVGAVVVIAIVCVVVVYMGIQYVPPGGENENQPPEKPTLEMPLAGVKAAIASREGVSQDSVEVYFCVPAEDVDNRDFAVGVVVNDQKSIVFIYDNSTSEVTVENEYTAATNDEQQAMSTIVLKDTTSPYAQDYLGRFSVNKIVPFGIVKTGNTYNFTYYDGYAIYPVDLWGHGSATIDVSGSILLLTHEWMT